MRWTRASPSSTASHNYPLRIRSLSPYNLSKFMAINTHINRIPRAKSQLCMMRFRACISAHPIKIHNKLIKHHRTVTPEKCTETRVITILQNKMTIQAFPCFQYKVCIIKRVDIEQWDKAKITLYQMIGTHMWAV